MANHKGSEGLVKVGTATVAEVTSWSFQESINLIDDSEMSDAAETHLTGRTKASGTVECHWDETDATGQGAMTIGASITLNLYPEGAVAADTFWSCTATISSIDRSTGIDEMVKASFAWTASGPVTESTVV